MTDLENRLTDALAERVGHLAVSPDAWELNVARLRTARPSPERRFRAPLLVAAAIALLAVAIIATRTVHPPAPAVPPPVVNQDGVGCGFNQVPNQVGASVTAQPLINSPDNRLLVMVVDTAGASSCFFDSVGWHHFQGGDVNRPLSLVRTSRAGGLTWLWGETGNDVSHVTFTDAAGQLTTAVDFGGFAFAIPIHGPGTVRAVAADGRVLKASAVDPTKGVDSPDGPVLRSLNVGEGGVPGGLTIACPTGAPSIETVQSVPTATPINFSLHPTGADGEPVVCVDGGTTSMGVVLNGYAGPPALMVEQSTSPRLWGLVQTDVSRLEITMGHGLPPLIFVSDPSELVDGAVLMSRLGHYRTFAAVEPAQVAHGELQIRAFDHTGKLIAVPLPG